MRGDKSDRSTVKRIQYYNNLEGIQLFNVHEMQRRCYENGIWLKEKPDACSGVHVDKEWVNNPCYMD